MKNLFKSLFTEKPVQKTSAIEQVETVTLETSKLDAVKTKYPQVVLDIHNEFFNAGERLLNEAKAIVANIHINNPEKIEKLNSFGFENTKESKDAAIKQLKKQEQEMLSQAIMYFSVRYPKNKVITDEVIKQICDKYSLVFGENSQYKGFVPEKNLNEIEDFFKRHEDERYVYGYYDFSRWGSGSSLFIKTSKAEFERQKKSGLISMNIIRRYNASLKICAPLKDMETDGYELKGHILVKEIPDPIVLLPKKHENGQQLYIILTAWGDEASDPMVVNEKNN